MAKRSSADRSLAARKVLAAFTRATGITVRPSTATGSP
jgi:hypothetical protein